jgi:CRISPR/Cas system CSM-associated protein Csm3 (group 7 of RAMP superfamily)
MLFDQEYVPEGIVFDVTMLVEGGGPNEWTPDDIAGALLAALQDLRESPARLGASNAEGWGRLEWRLNAVRRMGERAIAAWLAQPGSPLADHLQPADPEALLALGRTLLCAGRSETLDFEIDLRFDAPFLVNDASRVKRPGETSDKPNHTPLKALGDAPLLPASSMHGAMRSQAERIARTLGLPVCDPAGKKSERPPAIKNRGECSKLDVVSRLFGAPGWRSPLRISDFTLAPGSPDPGEPRTQEFVAIDRFTGGGADKLKFNAEAFTPAGQDGFTLRGTLSLDAHRLALLADGTPGWWDELLHLLTYTLRDLCEGDVPAGFGRSKGYGACTALVSLASDVNRCMGLPEPARTLIRGWFAERRIA